MAGRRTPLPGKGFAVATIFIDADACPVKEEVYRVAKRYNLLVMVVANSWMRIPDDAGLELVVVSDGFDAADDWIVEQARENDIVITTDIPLAARCLKVGARVLGPKGHVFREDSIGDALANRDMLANLRDAGMVTGGPAPFGPQDRSRFLQRLDAVVNEILRAAK